MMVDGVADIPKSNMVLEWVYCTSCGFNMLSIPCTDFKALAKGQDDCFATFMTKTRMHTYF